MKAGVSVKEFYLDKGAAREQKRIIKILKSLVINEWIEIHLVDLIKMGNK